MAAAWSRIVPTEDRQRCGAIAPLLWPVIVGLHLPSPMPIPTMVGTGALLLMEPFRSIRPIAPFNDAILPRRSGCDPPMPHPHVGDRSFEGRASLWMRGVRHRNAHGSIRSRQMKRGQASNRPAQHPGTPATGAWGVDFRGLHPGSQRNQTDRVLPSTAPANRWQLLNIQLDPMASDRNRAALPFFWGGHRVNPAACRKRQTVAVLAVGTRSRQSCALRLGPCRGCACHSAITASR